MNYELCIDLEYMSICMYECANICVYEYVSACVYELCIDLEYMSICMYECARTYMCLLCIENDMSGVSVL
jgi:hypothetical protein